MMHIYVYCLRDILFQHDQFIADVCDSLLLEIVIDSFLHFPF